MKSHKALAEVADKTTGHRNFSRVQFNTALMRAALQDEEAAQAGVDAEEAQDLRDEEEFQDELTVITIETEATTLLEEEKSDEERDRDVVDIDFSDLEFVSASSDEELEDVPLNLWLFEHQPERRSTLAQEALEEKQSQDRLQNSYAALVQRGLSVSVTKTKAAPSIFDSKEPATRYTF